MKRIFLAGLALVTAFAAPFAAEGQASSSTKPELLVDGKWLDENIIRPEIVVVDVRTRDDFDQGHIPGAYWVDENRLVRRDGPAASIIPPDEMKTLMESVGIGAGVHVVAVDETGGKSAARFWWILGYYGFDEVSLLDGGFDKWRDDGRALTGEYPFHRNAVFTPKVRPDRVATTEAVRDWKKFHPQGIVLDARSPAEYDGTILRVKRGGHVPGAINLPWSEAFETKNEIRQMKRAPELQTLFAKFGVTRDSQIVVYCLDGRRASHLLFSLARAGFNGANYVGSWLEWGMRSDLPVDAAKRQDVTPAKPRPSPDPAKPGSPATPPGSPSSR